ncbi:hypothetical protein TanjilG_11156 [Lupinus angustifolius]|uniref:Uncharacterized protein n=1 Tax=Lupinus angustifolius TaxID=3871 RepID=A0A1J7HXE0_LUPAN|nr:PREDICTED: uncharacterized protein LOC109325240 [Lupinus angustifolius]XP_019413017.1 PREDICTED: uncharacterized protein LOC109325240 [Lupinus angustifolius]OIW17592.1 hypothetical protein TanjilG_11156 [Lupinus angustifolius]
MGAKGKKRREKNYRAAHGGYTGLPPPPDPSKVDALPSKLRQIITFTHSQHKQQQQNSGLPKDLDKKRKRDDGHAPNGKGEVGTADFKEGDSSEQLKARQYTDNANDKKKKKKRKRKEAEDLRFAMEVDKTNSQLKRKERKKKYLESKKKHKKTADEDDLDFPRHEKIKFGDVVQAPPKLAFIPKALKNTQDASQERLRLRAIEEYRSRKGWTSRPGIHLPPPVVSDP